MVLPIITSLSREVFLQTPSMNEEAALALGATKWEMIRTAVLPYGRPGVIAAVMLGLGRALGETIALAMTLGSTFTISFNIIENGGNTIAANIANRFGEANDTGRGALIASGLVLFAITLVVNMTARAIIYRRREFRERPHDQTLTTARRRPAGTPDACAPSDCPVSPSAIAPAALVLSLSPRRATASARRLGPGRASSRRAALPGRAAHRGRARVEGRRVARNRMWQRPDLLRLRAGRAAARLGGVDAGQQGRPPGSTATSSPHSMNNIGARDAGGGAYHAIIGTLEQVGIATLITVPLGVLGAIYIVEYGRGRFATAIRFFVDVMTGIPSIVAGLFILAFWVLIVSPWFNDGRPGYSGFAAALALTRADAADDRPVHRGDAAAGARRRCARARTRWACRSGRRSCRSCCRPRCPASSPASCSPSPAPPARPPRCCWSPAAPRRSTSTRSTDNQSSLSLFVYQQAGDAVEVRAGPGLDGGADPGRPRARPDHRREAARPPQPAAR